VEPTRVLFIGNSYTSFNNLPRIVAHLAGEAGRPTQTEAVIKGGMTLDWHWYKNPSALDRIDRGTWDFVVLQDMSTRPVEEPERTIASVARFAERIRRAGATPAVYLTWARRRLPEMQAELTRTYTAAAAESDALLVPVGPAWADAFAASGELVLHTDDGSHPNILGSYLAACVFVATLFDISPVGLASHYPLEADVTATIDPTRAQLLQKAAQSACRSAPEA